MKQFTEMGRLSLLTHSHTLTHTHTHTQQLMKEVCIHQDSFTTFLHSYVAAGRVIETDNQKMERGFHSN